MSFLNALAVAAVDDLAQATSKVDPYANAKREVWVLGCDCQVMLGYIGVMLGLYWDYGR